MPTIQMINSTEITINTLLVLTDYKKVEERSYCGIINDPPGTDSWLYSKGAIDNTDDLAGWTQWLPHNL